MDSSHDSPNNLSSHSFHEGFVELEELISFDTELVWKERARWIKLEEDVEENANRWGKPHIPCLAFRSLREVEKNFESGVFLLDLQRWNLPSICEAIIEEIKSFKTLPDEEYEVVKTALLTRHEHQHQARGGRSKNFSRRISRILPQMPHQRRSSDALQSCPTSVLEIANTPGAIEESANDIPM